MTAVAPEGAETQVIRVPDAGRTLEFPGVLLGEVSTQIRDNPRWLEISLYKVTDGTGRYVLHLCGASVVYHRHKGPCNTGVPTLAAAMPLDAEPCRICRPSPIPDEESDLMAWSMDDPVKGEGHWTPLWDLEQDRYTTYRCKNAEEVVERLRKPRNRKYDDSGTLSAPAQRLLDLVAPKDEDLARIVHAVERL